MLQQRKLLALLFPLLFAHQHVSFAQATCAIHGIVTDETNKPAYEGIATLFRHADSAFVAIAPVENGAFSFAAIATGVYFLRVACGGYEELFRKVPLITDDTLMIKLKRKKTTLKEVEVTTYRNAFSYKNGNIKATVENTPLSTLPEAIEILSKLPTVQVSSDRESVSVIGKGEPLIYLDNQRITLNELNALAVTDIRSVEVINHPPARYEAEGRAVILVTRRVNNAVGHKIDITETAAKKDTLKTGLA